MTIIINPIINHLESAYANQINLQVSNNSIPEAIIKKAYSKVHKLPIPITKAYEKNADNEWVRVPVVRKNNMQLMSLPNDGIHTYTFNRYDPDEVKRNWHYEVVSIYRIANSSKVKIKTKYVLEQNVTTRAKVSLEISGKAEIKAAFLSKLEMTAGFRGGYERQWSKGWSADVNAEIPPHYTAFITNYQVGVNSRGALIYDKRTPSGAKCGEYKEITGGTVLNNTDLSIEITDLEPMVK